MNDLDNLDFQLLHDYLFDDPTAAAAANAPGNLTYLPGSSAATPGTPTTAAAAVAAAAAAAAAANAASQASALVQVKRERPDGKVRAPSHPPRPPGLMSSTREGSNLSAFHVWPKIHTRPCWYCGLLYRCLSQFPQDDMFGDSGMFDADDYGDDEDGFDGSKKRKTEPRPKTQAQVKKRRVAPYRSEHVTCCPLSISAARLIGGGREIASWPEERD